MADSKLSALPAASTLTGAELVYAAQGGSSVQTTAAAMAGLGYQITVTATFTSPIVGHNITVTVSTTNGLVPNQTVVIESADGTTLVMYGTVSSIVSATQFVFSIGFYGAGTPGTTVAIGTLVAPTGVPEIVQNLYTVVRATGIGSILFSWDSSVLKQDAAGNFLYDIDGTAFPSGTGGGLGTPNTLYIGGYHANSSGGTLALWDLGASAWQPISVDSGLFSFGIFYSASRQLVGIGGTLTPDYPLQVATASGTYVGNAYLSSDTTPTPYVASASTEVNPTNEAWQAFNAQTSGTYAKWTASTSTGWLQYYHGRDLSVTAYRITGPVSGQATLGPATWTFEGSNDGSTFTTLDTQTSAPSWGTLEQRTYTLGAVAVYPYYRLNVTANQGSSLLSIVELDLLSPGSNIFRADADDAAFYGNQVVVRQGRMDFFQPGSTYTLGTPTSFSLEADGGALGSIRLIVGDGSLSSINGITIDSSISGFNFGQVVFFSGSGSLAIRGEFRGGSGAFFSVPEMQFGGSYFSNPVFMVGQGQGIASLYPVYFVAALGTTTTALHLRGNSAGQTAPLQVFESPSSTSTVRTQADFTVTYVVQTDATYTSRLVLNVYDYAGTREAMRAESTGSAAALSFYGASAVTKQTITGSKGGNVALANLLTALANLGLIIDSTT